MCAEVAAAAAAAATAFVGVGEWWMRGGAMTTGASGGIYSFLMDESRARAGVCGSCRCAVSRKVFLSFLEINKS
jgi:hypothetical protein